MRVTVTLPGPAPWGFRISGGRDFGKPIAVSKVGAPHASPGPGKAAGGPGGPGCSGSGSCSLSLGDPAPWERPRAGDSGGGSSGGPRAGQGCAKFPGVVPEAVVPSWQSIPEGGSIPAGWGWG